MLRPLVTAFGLAIRPLSACSQISRRLPPPLAYRETHERRGEAVRKLDHKYCHIVVRLCFCIRHVLAHIRGESFSVGLHLAKITGVRAKEGLCLSLLRYAALCNARFLARFARYAAFCIARFLARSLSSDLPVLRSGLFSGLPAKTTEAGAKITETCDRWCPCPQTSRGYPPPACLPRQRRHGLSGACPQTSRCCHHLLPTEGFMNGRARPCENDRRYCQHCNQIIFLHEACAYTYSWGVSR